MTARAFSVTTAAVAALPDQPVSCPIVALDNVFAGAELAALTS